MQVRLPRCLAALGDRGAMSGTARATCLGRSLLQTLNATTHATPSAGSDAAAPGVGVCLGHALVSARLLGVGETSCHYVGHEVGSAVWHAARGPDLTNAQDLARVSKTALSTCPSHCVNGCIHRVMVHTIATAIGLAAVAGTRSAFTMEHTKLLIGVLRPLLAVICDYKGLDGRQDPRYGLSCNHGAGHGLAALVQPLGAEAWGTVGDTGAAFETPARAAIDRVSTAAFLCAATLSKPDCEAGVQ